jgi:hypothetical protein
MSQHRTASRPRPPDVHRDPAKRQARNVAPRPLSALWDTLTPAVPAVLELPVQPLDNLSNPIPNHTRITPESGEEAQTSRNDR